MTQLILLNLICFTLAIASAALEGFGARRLLAEVFLACIVAGAAPAVGLAIWETSNRQTFAESVERAEVERMRRLGR